MIATIGSRTLPVVGITAVSPVPEYDMGQRVELFATLENDAGTATNATAVTVRISDPAGTQTLFVATNTATGAYQYLLDIPKVSASAGTWTFRFEALGTIIAADERTFTIPASPFYTATAADPWPDAVPGATLTPIPLAPTVIMAIGADNMAAEPFPTLGFSAGVRFLGDDLQAWTDTTGAFVAMVDGSANLRANAADVGTGAGPGGGVVMAQFCRQLADVAGATVDLFANCYPGQGVAVFADDSATLAYYEDGSQHATLNNYDLLSAAVTASALSLQLICIDVGIADAGDTQAAWYAKGYALIASLAITYPIAHILLVTTVHPTDDVAGAQAAQRQLAEENPHVHIVDTADMATSTAHFGRTGDVDRYTPRGFAEVALRMSTALQGITRPDVTIAEHAADSGLWAHLYAQSRAVAAGNGDSESVTTWSDLIGTAHLVSATEEGTHVDTDHRLGHASAVKLARDNTQSYKVAIPGGAGEWSFLLRFRMTLDPGLTMTGIDLNDPSFPYKRLGFHIFFQSNLPATMYAGNGVKFDDAPIYDTDEHVMGVTISATDLETRLYIDGAHVATEAVDGTQNTFGTPDLRVGSFNGTTFFSDGLFSIVAVASSALTEAQMLAAHAWAMGAA